MDLSIAFTLSGGGFRASVYHLGTLSYLNHLKFADGTTFLNHVSSMSTISGGTLTGLWYMLNLCRGVDTTESLRELKNQLFTVDIFGKTTDEFFDANNQNASLIKEMTRVYDELFFHGATFGEILDGAGKVSVRHFSANATDFTHSAQFRFQASRTQSASRVSQGVIGNTYCKLPNAIASQVRLSEIFAASSCFPGGFEPLMFPGDFQLAQNKKNSEYLGKTEPMGLMDGGVLDNQGVEPILLQSKRENVDLIIVGDAGRGKESAYEENPVHALENWSIHRINVTLNFIVLFLGQFLIWVPQGFWMGFFLSLTIFALVIRLTIFFLSRKYIKKAFADIPFHFNWKNLLKVRFNKFINFVKTRAESLYLLNDVVFMRHIRKLNYADIYENSKWENRRIMNALYELRENEDWDNHLTDEQKPMMEPSEAIGQNSKTATAMATTLWFSDDDRKAGKPEALITTGQYNICWNLLEYICRLKQDSDNTTEAHQQIMTLEDQLKADWEKFKQNPNWMLDF